MFSKYCRVLPALLLGFGLVAVPALAEPPATKTASDWKSIQNKAAHFEVSIPAGWNAIEMDPALIDSSLNEIAKTNPDLGKAFGPQARALVAAGIKFLAIDSAVDLAKVGFATNFNVLQDQAPPGISIEDFLHGNAAQLKGLSSVEGVEERLIELGGRRAGRLEYRMMVNPAAGLEVSITQVFVIQGESSLIFTFTTLPSQLSHYAPLFEQMIGRIRVFD